MKRKKLRDLTIVFFVGLFVMTFEPVFLWLLIGAMVLLHGERAKEKKSESVLHRIGRDAGKHGLEMPRTSEVRGLLIQLYIKLEKSSAQYPHLQSEYNSIVEEMWTTLSDHQNKEFWTEVISSVISSWPESKKSGMQAVKDQINRVNELTEQWEEAQREVRGGAHV